MAAMKEKERGNTNLPDIFFVKQKKGFFFTIDALLAASILLGGLIILSTYYVSEKPTVHLNYLSQDIINSFATMKINELNNNYVDALIAGGEITDLNNSILEQLGEFWAFEKFDIAENFIKNITQGILPERLGFGVWISNDLIYKRDYPAQSSVASARKMLSGYERKRPFEDG